MIISLQLFWKKNPLFIKRNEHANSGYPSLRECIYKKIYTIIMFKSFARTYLEIGLRKDVEGKFIL